MDICEIYTSADLQREILNSRKNNSDTNPMRTRTHRPITHY